jgi:hypothetical protein
MPRALIQDAGPRAVDQAAALQKRRGRLPLGIRVVRNDADEVVVGVQPLEAQRTRTVQEQADRGFVRAQLLDVFGEGIGSHDATIPTAGSGGILVFSGGQP